VGYGGSSPLFLVLFLHANSYAKGTVTFAALVNAHNNTAVAMLLHSGPCGPFIFAFNLKGDILKQNSYLISTLLHNNRIGGYI